MKKIRILSNWDHPKKDIMQKDKELFGKFLDSENKVWEWDNLLKKYIKQ